MRASAASTSSRLVVRPAARSAARPRTVGFAVACIQALALWVCLDEAGDQPVDLARLFHLRNVPDSVENMDRHRAGESLGMRRPG